MSLEDEIAGDQPEITLAKNAAGMMFRLVEDQRFDADEITPEGQFPKFGKQRFLRVDHGEGTDVEYVEAPDAMVDAIVTVSPTGDRVGRWFHVESVSKNVEGQFRFSVDSYRDREAAEEALTSR
jgi:hypothetical protein